MKRLFLLGLLFYIVLLPAYAQDNGQSGDSPIAKPVAHGIWIYLGNRLPKNMEYQIERKKQGSEKYKKIGSTTAPVSESEMEQRQQTYGQYFTTLDPLDQGEINSLWEYFVQHVTTDSIISNNLPMMHLAAGTAFFDNTADENTGYVYRVSLLGTDGSKISQQESNVSTSLQENSLPTIYFSSKKYADGKLSLTWGLMDKKEMAHFNVYRTIFGKDDYQKIKIEKGAFSKKDSLMLLAIDSLGKGPAWYEYKIAPVDAFGNEGDRQGYANGGNLQDYYSPPVTNLRAINTHSNHEVKISWHYENKKYLNGVTLMRSPSYDTGYRRIATVSVNDSVYTDILPVSGENYYYYLLLQSAENDPVPTAKIFSVYTDENERPNPPREIDAVTIPDGIKIYWKSEEEFSKGFYVYRRENPDEQFTQVSPLVPKGMPVYSFADTTGQLQGADVYEYVVRTLNENNRLSEPSDTVSAHPGIKLSLTPPMNLRYRNNDGRITLLWEDMRPWENNLLGYKVYRKVNNGTYTALANDSIRPEKNFYIDSLATSGNSYSYAVTDIDFFGNESEKSTIALPALAETVSSPPSGITLSQSGKDVYVSWGQIAGDVSSIKVYRSEPGQQVKMIGTVSDADLFIDKNISNGKLYFYQLSVVNKKDKEGMMSEKTAIRVK